MNISTFGEVSIEFEASCNWLSSLGIAFEKSRMARYRTSIERFATMDELRRAGVPRDSADETELQNTLFEIGEITQLYSAFKAEYPEGFMQSAEIVCRGRDSYAEEQPDSNTEGRNYMFELLVAARLSLSGLAVDLAHTDDVTWRATKGIVSVQCKRSKTLNSIRRNIEKADRQIQKDIDQNHLDIKEGLIAIDLTAAINPEFELYREQSVDKIQNRIKEELEGCLRRYADTGFQISESVSGILARHSAIGHATDTGDPYYTQLYSLWIRTPSEAMRELVFCLDKDGSTSGLCVVSQT